MHTSREIAQAIVDRAFVRVASKRYPQPVELPPVLCLSCEGHGAIDVSRIPWHEELRECKRCHGTGERPDQCCFCDEPPVVWALDDDGCRWELCAECAATDDAIEGDVLAILKRLP